METPYGRMLVTNIGWGYPPFAANAVIDCFRHTPIDRWLKTSGPEVSRAKL